MSQLREPVPIHDIVDAEAFVADTLNRMSLKLAPDEREELIAEGLAIVVRMGNEWAEGHKHSGKGRFAGYVSYYLPKRLLDAWHRSHREHTFATTPEGKREWRYGDAPVSLDQGARVDDGGEPDLQIDPRNPLAVAPEPDPADTLPAAAATAPPALPSTVHLALRPLVAQEPHTDAPEHRLGVNVRRALELSLRTEAELHEQVALRLAAGYSQRDVCHHLGLSQDDLKAAVGRLRRCAYLLDGVATPDTREAA